MLITEAPVRLTDRLWMLGTVAYPIYLFQRRQEAAIFEGGIGAMGPLLDSQLDQLEIDRPSVKQVIVTHGHPDHVMAIPVFRELFPGVAVLASKVAATTLSTERAVSFFCKIDAALTGSLVKAGLIGQEHRLRPLAEMQIAVDRIISEGDTISIEDVRFNVLETPGHSDCSLSFFEPQDKVLIISDASGYYLPDHECWWPNYFGDYAVYMDSMRRLAGLGAEILCLSHNGVIKGAEEVKRYFDGALAATETYHERILGEREAGKSVRQIAEQLGSEVYEKTQLLPLDFFQKNCGVLVKNSLRHEGISPAD